MTTVTVHVKNKITGFKNSEQLGGLNVLDKEIPAQYNVNIADGTEIPNDIGNQQIIVLKKRIKVLEAALQKAREEAFQSGFEEGKETAQIEAKRHFEDLSNEFMSMVESLKVQYDQAMEKMDQPLLKLAMKVAEIIIGKELSYTHEYNEFLTKQIRKFLNEVADQNKISIYVNPNHIDWVTKGDILKELNLPSKAGISFVGSDKLKPGECLLETEDYIIEGILSRQLDNLENQILDEEP